MKVLHMIGSAALALAVLATPATAQRREPPKALAVSAQNLMAGDAQHQALAKRGGDPNTVLSGDVVRYRLVFTNVTDVPVRNVEFKDPLPAGLRYMAASAGADREDVAIEYSIDGGATYAAQPMVEEMVDGKPVRKPAPVELYTHIRWRVEGWVAPGAQVTAEFRATLPEPKSR
jgi:uncharacterized repeat protein (TIGR01451 family)